MNEKEEIIYNRRWIILFSVVIVIFMTCVDASIINVALPVIARELKVTMESVQWTITIYLLVISGLILTFGKLGDTIGKERVFRVGIIIFTVGSLFSGLSTSIGILILSRGVQGLGAACTMANSKGIITATFNVKERGKALGITALVVALGGMLGPAIGGVISEFKWQYIFFINIPIGIFATILAFKVFPIKKEKNIGKLKIDIVGTLLFLITISALIVGINEGSIYGYTTTYTLILFLITIVGFIIFIYTQIKFKESVLDIRIFKNHKFSKGIIASFLIFIATSGYNILIPFYYELVRKLSPGMSGLLMVVYPIALSVASPIAGALSDKMRRELFPLIGLLVCGIGFALLGTVSVNTSMGVIIIYLIITGIGNGIFQAPLNTMVLSSVEKDKLGIAGSITGLVRNLGMAFGVIFGTSLLYEIMSRKLGYTVKGFIPGQEVIFTQAMDIVLIIGAILCFIGVGIILSLIFRKNKTIVYK